MAKDEPVDPTTYADKPATALQARFGEWIQTEVGYDPSKAKTKLEAFLEGVRIATATRMVFQASDFNRAANAESRAANEARRKEAEAARATEAEAEPKPARKAAPAKAAPAAKKAPAKKAAAPAAEAEEAPAPAKRPAPRRAPRRAPAAAAASATEAPF